MRHTLAGVCSDTLRPLNPTDVEARIARQVQIRRSMAKVATEAQEATARRVCWVFIVAMIILSIKSLFNT